MAGFAVGVNHYVKMADKFNEVKRNFTIMKFRRGYEENSFLINMRVPPKKFEFLCDNCQKVKLCDLFYIKTYFHVFYDLFAGICLAYTNKNSNSKERVIIEY